MFRFIQILYEHFIPKYFLLFVVVLPSLPFTVPRGAVATRAEQDSLALHVTL